MLYSGFEEIKKLIPQREPIMMVDTFYGIDNDTNISKSSLLIDKENIFVRKNHFSEEGLLEHAAQSAAARMGYLCLSNNQPISLGFIGSINKVETFSLPSINEKIYTTIEILQEVGNISLISFQTFDSKEKQLCRGQMKIVLDI